MWKTFFIDGGWGMYPTSFFGLCLVASAVLLVLRPERRSLFLSAALALLTLGSGMLGTATGLVNTARFVVRYEDKSRQFEMFAIGLGESLNNTILSLVIFEFAMLLVVVAAFRIPRNSLKSE